MLSSKHSFIINIILKKLSPFFFLLFVSVCFADIKNVVCFAEDKDLLNQSFYVDHEKKIISMKDDRKIFDVKFSNDSIKFKKSLSIRNLDTLTIRNPEHFIFELDIASMNLYVSISKKPGNKYKYICKS